MKSSTRCKGESVKVTRREFIYGTGGAFTATLILPSGLALADNYDDLRNRWSTQLLGANYDPNAEPFDSLLTELGVQASVIMSEVQTGTWPTPALTASDMTNVGDALSELSLLARA